MRKQREAFESWVKAGSTLSVTRDAHGYVDMTVALMWHAWQAAQSKMAPAWPTLEAASADMVFHQARGIMGTENMGQDDALRQAVLHVFAEQLRGER